MWKFDTIKNYLKYRNKNSIQEQQILEKKGISLGVKYLSENIADIIADFCSSAYSEFHRTFAYALKNKVDSTVTQYGVRHILKFSLDPAYILPDTSVWLSPETEIVVDLCIYNETAYEGKIRANAGAELLSVVEDSNGKYKGKICIWIDSYRDFNTTWKVEVFWLGENIKFSLSDNGKLSAVIQHEFNHMRSGTKQIFDNIQDSEKRTQRKNAYEKSYANLIGLMTSSVGLSPQIAYGIYRYCIREERKAHVEQFYNEMNTVGLKNSEIYSSAVKDREFFEKLKTAVDKPIADKVYDRIYSIYTGLFGNAKAYTKEQSTAFTNHLIKLILTNIEKSLKLYQRAASVKENTDYSVNESWKILASPVHWK